MQRIHRDFRKLAYNGSNEMNLKCQIQVNKMTTEGKEEKYSIIYFQYNPNNHPVYIHIYNVKRMPIELLLK